MKIPIVFEIEKDPEAVLRIESFKSSIKPN